MSRIIVITEDELRRLIREELAAQKVEVTVRPDMTTFTPVGGGPVRQIKMPKPPQDGGQGIEF